MSTHFDPQLVQFCMDVVKFMEPARASVEAANSALMGGNISVGYQEAHKAIQSLQELKKRIATLDGSVKLGRGRPPKEDHVQLNEPS